MSSPTLQQLADELGVHKATVSRALSGKSGVSESVRRRILEMADQRGFFPNGQARSLATSRTETIALVFCDETSEFLTNPFYSKVLAGIAEETAEHEFSLAFCSLSTDRLGRDPLPKIMRERRADGYLFVGDQDDELIRYAHNLNYPLVLVDHRFGGGCFDSVAIDNVGGARKAVEYLISLGHRRIGFVGGSLHSPSFEERLSGYREALAAHGISFDESLVQVGSSYAGRENMLNLANLAEKPTAVFVCNDVNAAKAIKAIRERNLNVPDDISVVGFDDSFRASECWPQLTTMRADAEVMGRMAVRRLVKRIAREAAVPEQVLMDTELVVRGSTGFPKQGRRLAGSRKIQQTTGKSNQPQGAVP